MSTFESQKWWLEKPEWKFQAIIARKAAHVKKIRAKYLLGLVQKWQ